MSNTTTPAMVAELSQELGLAGKIILTMLKHMTPEQKRAAHIELETDGDSGEGMTRYHERQQALDRACKVGGIQVEAEDTSNGPIFCKDCLYIEKGTYPRCKAPAVRRINLVSGYYGPRCDSTREDSGQCGPEGKLFMIRASKPQSSRATPFATLSFHQDTTGLGVGKIRATLGIDSIPIRSAPSRESVGVDVRFDDDLPLSDISLATLFGQILPLQETKGQLIPIDEHGTQFLVVRFSIPNHA